MSNFKLKNGNYIDTTGIKYNNEILSDIISKYKSYPIYYKEITSTNKNYNIDTIASEFENKNAIIISGLYGITSIIGSPISGINNSWGLLITIKNSTTFSSITDFQILMTQYPSIIFIRCMSNKKWYVFNSDTSVLSKTE